MLLLRQWSSSNSNSSETAAANASTAAGVDSDEDKEEQFDNQSDKREEIMEKGRLLFKRDMYAQAYMHYKQALEMQADSRVLLCLGRTCMRLKRPEEAFGYCEQAIQMEPEKHEVHYVKALALMSLGKYDEAKQVLLGVLEFVKNEPKKLSAIHTKIKECDRKIATAEKSTKSST
jgi:tetratricopeptide (TPR) repeat protein